MIIVTINAIETETTGINITQALTHTPDTCSFALHDPDNVPSAGQEVYCYLDSTSGTKLFGGVITTAIQSKLAPHDISTSREYTYHVECEDFTRLLDSRLVSAAYTSQKSDAIISDIVTNFTDAAHGFTENNVEVSRTITRIVFNYVPVSQALSDMADLLEWDWYVDYDKDIHFFERETRPAPFDIDDDAVRNTIDNFRINPDYSQIRNRVFVRGGYFLSDEYTDSWVADGESRVWATGYAPHEPSSLKVDGVANTYAIDYLNLDDGTYEFFWNYSERYIRCSEFGATTPTPGVGDVIEFKYKYEVPVIVQVDNILSQTAIAAIEGGDGIYESIIRDETIDSLNLAHERGLAEVNQFGNVQISGSFTTYESGFAEGQFVNISVPGYESFAGKYQIRRVSIQPFGPNAEYYTVEFAVTLYELKDLLLSLVRDRSRIKLRADETVDIFKIITESITVTETSIDTYKYTHPVKWGPTAEQSRWNEFTWG